MPSDGRRSTIVNRQQLGHAEELASDLPPLLVAAQRVAATVYQGVHGRRRVGPGTAFWEFRPYQPGDPTRRIDWRQTAKSQKVFVRETEWEAAQSVRMWWDASPSMDYRSSGDWPVKRERAELLLLALASLLSRGGEHFALIDELRRTAPGRNALRRLAQLIERHEVDGESLPRARPLPGTARVVLFGDFLSPLNDIRSSIAALSAGGIRGHVVQILDPAEHTLPFSGRVLFEGLEGEGTVLFGRVETIRERYAEALAAHQDGLRSLLGSFGWTFLMHRTDQPPQGPLTALYLSLSSAAGR